MTSLWIVWILQQEKKFNTSGSGNNNGGSGTVLFARNALTHHSLADF